jgi:serine/threonine-protein kinase RsbW
MMTEIYPGEFSSLSDISDFVVQQAKKANFSPRQIYAIQTAVDEACSNIIDHAYGGENLGYIEISVERIEGGIQITIVDDGKPFNPDEVPIPDTISPLEDRRERGLGVYFMRKLMDEVCYDFSNPTHNTLVMIKHREID